MTTEAPDALATAARVVREEAEALLSLAEALGDSFAQAHALIDQAIGHLSGFGAEADLLRAIARFAVDRDN